jgi:transposase-like protein
VVRAGRIELRPGRADPEAGDRARGGASLAHSAEIRRVIYSTNAIESLHARFRRAVRVRGHFPNEQAALKCLYLTVRSLGPTGRGRALDHEMEARTERVRDRL